MSDENVGGLVAYWRHMADRAGAESSADSASDELLAALRAEATTYRRCANMLEAALSAHGQLEPNGKLVGWWNGISRHDDRDGTGPSVRWGEGAENTYHDIPLYDGYNPIHYVTPTAHGQPVADDSQRKWAQGLIEQLPREHDGRNSWLLNYGVGHQSDWLRAEHKRYRQAWQDWRDGYPQPTMRRYQDATAALTGATP